MKLQGIITDITPIHRGRLSNIRKAVLSCELGEVILTAYGRNKITTVANLLGSRVEVEGQFKVLRLNNGDRHNYFKIKKLIKK